MCDSDDTRDPVEELAEEFLERHRRGEHPSVSEYAEAHPAWAERIRELFPALVVLEGIKSDSYASTDAGNLSNRPEELPERLGDFRILREIGHGGMGVVYEAEQLSLGRRVALKVLPASYSSSPQALRRFRREAQAAARLHHTNIVSVFGVGEHEGRHFYVMQYIDGSSLDHVLAELARCQSELSHETRCHDPSRLEGDETLAAPLSAEVARNMLAGRFEPTPSRRVDVAETDSTEPDDRVGTQVESSEGQVANRQQSYSSQSAGHEPSAHFESFGVPYWRSVAVIGAETADALHHAHKQGTLHRDIKPANLLLDREQNVWITDFGLAKLTEQEDLTQSGDMVGTLRYMAPEQLEGTADARSDVFSLGLTLYELLTLRPAFDATSRHGLIRQVSQHNPSRPRAANPSVPRDLETIVLKAIARDPAHRYQTAVDLADDLKRFLDDRPIRARRTSAIEHFWRWCRRNPALASVSAVAVLLLLMVVAGASARYVHRARNLERQTQLREQAERQRERAEANLQLAIEAFEDIFDKLGHPIARETLGDVDDIVWYQAVTGPSVSEKDAALLASLLEFFDRFAEKNRDYEQLQLGTAHAYRRVGDIRFYLGELDEAETAYRRASDMLLGLAQRGVTEPGYVAEAAELLNDLGMMARDFGRFEEGVEFHRRAEQFLGSQSPSVANSADCRFQLARTYNALAFAGSIHRMLGISERSQVDQLAESEQQVNRALDILGRLIEQDPDQPDYRLAIAESYGQLSWCKVQQQDSSGATEAETQAIRTLETLNEDSPGNALYRHALAKAYSRPRGAQGDPASDDLLQQLSQAYAIAVDLTTQYPQMTQQRSLLQRICLDLAHVLYVRGDIDATIEKCEEGVRIGRSLTEQYPTMPRYRGSLAMTLFAMAGIELDRGRPAKARQHLNESLETLESMTPPAERFQIRDRMHADHHALLAEVLRALDETELAEEAARKAEQIGRHAPPLPEEFPASRFKRLRTLRRSQPREDAF